MSPFILFPEWCCHVNDADNGSMCQSCSDAISCSPQVADEDANGCSDVLADGAVDGFIHVPAEELTNVLADELTNVLVNEPTNVLVDELTNVPTNELTNVLTDELTNVPVDELTNVLTDELTNVPVDELTNVLTDELTNVPTDELTNVSADELTKVPTDELINLFIQINLLTNGYISKTFGTEVVKSNNAQLVNLATWTYNEKPASIIAASNIAASNIAASIIAASIIAASIIAASIAAESVNKFSNKTVTPDNDEASQRNIVIWEIVKEYQKIKLGIGLQTFPRLEDEHGDCVECTGECTGKCTGKACSRKSSSKNHWSSNAPDLPAASAPDLPAANVLDLPAANVLDLPAANVLDLPDANVLDLPAANVLDLPDANDRLKAENNSLCQGGYYINYEDVADDEFDRPMHYISSGLKSLYNAPEYNLISQFKDRECGTNVGMDLEQNNSIEVDSKSGSLFVNGSNSYRNLCQDISSNPGSDLKFDPQIHMPWRHNVLAFPLTQTTSLRIATESVMLLNNLYCFMNFEVFRICSFNILEFPADLNAHVSSLAKNGYYYSRPEVVCFACGNKSAEFMVSFLENSHRAGCPRDVLNVPLSRLMHGFNLEEFTDFYTRYSSLTPYLSEQDPDAFERTDTAAPSGRYPGANHPDSQTSCSSGYSSAAPSSRKFEKDCSDNAEAVNGHLDKHDLSKVSTGASRQFLVDDRLHDLQPNLNAASAHIINQESPEEHRSCKILTSIARHPVSFNERDLFHQAVAGNEDVAEREAAGHVNTSLDLSSAAFPFFATRSVRKQTFQTWSPEHTQLPEDLVANGFFYTGQDHRVQCFYCGVGLQFSKPTDIPAYQHVKYQPNCLFVRMYKGQDYVDHVLEDILCEQGASSTNTYSQLEPAAIPAAIPAAKPASIPAATEGTAAASLQRYMNSEAVQEAVESRWPIDQIHVAVKHIVEVFGDSCLEAELLMDVLRNFNVAAAGNPGESLINDHSTNSRESEISDIASLAGPVQSFNIPVVAEAERADGEHGPERERPLAEATGVQRPAAPILNFPEIFNSVQREHELLVERTTCRVCLTRPICTIYLPCGHVIACQECADAANHCFICRKQIVGTANIYLA